VALFAGFEVERFDEEEEDGSATSEDKHWHLFHAVTRKANAGTSASGS
jgi:hypothetical protein